MIQTEEDRELIKTVYAPPRAQTPWRLEDLLGTRVRTYSYGRFALREALRACGVGSGDRVLVPGLFCRDVLWSVNSLGAAPLFYEVGKDLAPTSAPEVLPKAKAVLVVDYFGFPADMRPFRRYASLSGAWIVEDNAHGLLSLDERGRWLGLRGDLGVFSIRKTVSLPNGAALVSTDGPALPEQPPFSAAPQAWRALKGLLRRSVSTLGVGPLRTAVSSRRGVKRLLKRSEFPSSGPKAETSFDESPEPCLELSGPLEAADPRKEVWRRRQLYRLCESVARANGGAPVFEKLSDGVSPLVFPFYARGRDLERTRRALSRLGLDTYPWPELPDAVAPAAPAHYKSLWAVRFLW